MRRVIPSQFSIDEAAADLVAKCAREMASALSCEALTMAAIEKKVKLTGMEIAIGARELGYDQLFEGLMVFQARHAEHITHCQLCAHPAVLPRPAEDSEDNARAPPASQSATNKEGTKKSYKKKAPQSQNQDQDQNQMQDQTESQKVDQTSSSTQITTVDQPKPSSKTTAANSATSVLSSSSEPSKQEEAGATNKKKGARNFPRLGKGGKDWLDPQFLQEVQKTIADCHDKTELVRHLSKHFHLSMKETNERFGSLIDSFSSTGTTVPVKTPAVISATTSDVSHGDDNPNQITNNNNEIANSSTDMMEVEEEKVPSGGDSNTMEASAGGPVALS
eukprot:gene1074-1164_t